MKIYKKWYFIIGCAIALGSLFGSVYLLVRGNVGLDLATLIEFFLFGAALVVISMSYEATRDIYNQPDERSQLIRMKAGNSTLYALSIALNVPAIIIARFIDGDIAGYIRVTLFGVFALIWLIYATMLIYYDRKI